MAPWLGGGERLAAAPRQSDAALNVSQDWTLPVFSRC
jgi:hypothetical protein